MRRIRGTIIAVPFLLGAAAPPAFSDNGRQCRLTEIASGSGENHLLFHGASPDGRTLAIGWDRGSGATTVRGAYLLDLRNGRRTILPHLNNAPAFSPDGRFLVSANYASQRELRTELVELDRRTGQARTLASGPSGEWLGSYSPNGRSILFNSTRSGASDLYQIDRTRGTIDRLTNDPRYEAHGQYIAGGRKLLFHRQTAGNDYDVMLVDLRSGETRAIGATPREEAYPAMSPGDRWIAFSAVEAGGNQPNLFVMRRDGSGRRRLTHGPAKDAYAAWSPDGRSLYFVRFHETGSRIYLIRMRDGDCVR